MRRSSKLILLILAVIAISQVPFAVNRFRTEGLAEKIRELDARRIDTTPGAYVDYKGVIHAHSFLGGHSTGTFQELLDGASQNGLDFVLMTEHVSDAFDTSSMTLTGRRGDVLWVGGNEISTYEGDRFLVFCGFEDLPSLSRLPTVDFLEEIHSRGHLAFVAYPGRFRSWNAEMDGIEVFSLNSNARKMNALMFVFDAIWSYRSYPELTLARYFKRPDDDLAAFDSIAKRRKITLTGGNDSHSNLGIHIGDDSNNKLIDLKLDSYSTTFSLLRTHVLVPAGEELTQVSLLEALKHGRSFLGFDVLGDAAGFSFSAENGTARHTLGDLVSIGEGPWKLSARTPLPARMVLFRDGTEVYRSQADSVLEFIADEKGSYRVEAYIDSFGPPFDKMPWIISNPIYIR